MVGSAVSLTHILHCDQPLGWNTKRYRMPSSIDAQAILSIRPKTDAFISAGSHGRGAPLIPQKHE